MSLHVIDLRSEAEMTQLPLQVEPMIPLSSCEIRIISPLICSVKISVSMMFQLFNWFTGFLIYFTLSIVLLLTVYSSSHWDLRPVLALVQF